MWNESPTIICWTNYADKRPRHLIRVTRDAIKSSCFAGLKSLLFEKICLNFLLLGVVFMRAQPAYKNLSEFFTIGCRLYEGTALL